MRRTRWGARSRAGVLAAGLLLCAAGCGDGGTDSDAEAGPKGEAVPAASGRALDAEALRQALPDPHGLPPGWRTGVTPPRAKEVPRARRCAEGTAHGNDCSMFHAIADVQYRAPGDSGSVYWTLLAYPDRRTAETAFANRRKAPEGTREITTPRVGDESTAYSTPAARHATPSTDMVFRVGDAVAKLTYQDADKNKDSAQVLLTLARAQADRLRRADRTTS
ncbi:hypothetical protein [Streptomyces mobaraensis]|uniref:DUF3558 domain-containing protein n=1 Tax=Streptomyces mobaraensis TaxID=35621 RepID=A0A5N5W1B9_STRMB|nr:hypothetical protein [Streptomyces mobaraensis]KAB7834539.1 hypothetical protein FRZ00_29850 [Streptomyces mobaraensis]